MAHDIPHGLAIEPVVDWRRRLMKRRILAPAACADAPDFTTKPRAFLLDLLGQILLLGADLAGASNIVLACRQIEVPIGFFDLLEIILGGLQDIPFGLQVILGWAPMTDRSLHEAAPCVAHLRRRRGAIGISRGGG
jgi:hypothetical protein